MSEPDFLIPQSAALPYRWHRGDLSILLVTSLTSRRWVIPKGHIDTPLTASQSAEKEAFEEAGITGRIATASIGAYNYTKRNAKGETCYRVEVFPLEVLKELEIWPEDLRRQRMWMAPGAAATSVQESELGALIVDFAATHSR